jgi:hypothetical protein
MHPRTRLLLTSAAIALVWQLPYGQMALYPLTLLATYVHEMGHGLMALLLGHQFHEMLLHADGSGMAVWQGNPGRLETALIAAGGLLGPTLAGVGLLLLSGSSRLARTLLVVLALVLLASMALWSRNIFGLGFLLVWAVVLLLAARYLPAAGAAWTLQLIAITLCLSWFTDLDYMFSGQAVVGGVTHLSDSAVIAQALFLPYWFWGGLVALLSMLLLLLLGVAVASRDPARPKVTLTPHGTLPPV